MCLKFLLEGNRENQAIVEELEAREIVQGSGRDGGDGDGTGKVGAKSATADILHDSGLEAKLCDDGKVRLVETGRQDQDQEPSLESEPEPEPELGLASGPPPAKEKGVAVDRSMEELMELLDEPFGGSSRATG